MSPMQMHERGGDMLSTEGISTEVAPAFLSSLTAAAAAADATSGKPTGYIEDEDAVSKVPDWSVARMTMCNNIDDHDPTPDPEQDKKYVELAYRSESVTGTAALLDYLGNTKERGVRLMRIGVDMNFVMRLGYVVVLISFGIFSSKFLD